MAVIAATVIIYKMHKRVKKMEKRLKKVEKMMEAIMDSLATGE